MQVVRILLLALLLASPLHAETFRVTPTQDLQAIVNSAQAGDVIVLTAGETYTVGQISLPLKSGVVKITTNSVLPDRQVTPADAALLPIVRSGITAAPFIIHNSANWIISGLRIEENLGGYGESFWIENSDNITLDRILIDVPEPKEQKRFILGNGRNITVTRNYCDGIWRDRQDSQCFAAWNGAGPYTVTDNFFSAASENILFGGSDSLSPADVPSDILIARNTFTKREIWRTDPILFGIRQVKNLLELKAAKRVVIRDNVFSKNWVQAQGGAAILFTPRNQGDTAPWSVISDVEFIYNDISDTPTAFNITGYDDLGVSQQTTRIKIAHNLVRGAGGGRFATVGAEVGVLEFDHNTYLQTWNGDTSMIALYRGGIKTATGSREAGYAVADLKIHNSMLQYNTWGVHSPVGIGTAALDGMTLKYSMLNNVLGGGSGIYPATTVLVPLDVYAAQFTPTFYLAQTSPFKGMATDGQDVGRVAAITTEPPPPPTIPPVPPLPTPEIEALKAQVQALVAKVSGTEAKLAALLNYLGTTPSYSKIQQLIAYLRTVPK